MIGRTCGRSQTLRSLFLALLFAPHVHAQAFHPADTNQDNAITLSEIGAYTNLINDRANALWQQAQFLWQEGERYTSNDALAPPYKWLPEADGANAYVALDKRRGLPFDVIEVLGLPLGIQASASCQVEGTDAWIDLDPVEDAPSGTTRFHLPYIPSPWLDSPWLKIRLTNGGTTYLAGRVWLQRVDRTDYPLPDLLEDMQVRLERYLTETPDQLAATVAAGGVIDEGDRQLAYYHWYASELRQTWINLRRNPHPDTEIGLISAE